MSHPIGESPCPKVCWVQVSFVEIGEEHGGICFGNGVQYTTGCTLGKGNLEKTPYGKLALTLIERASNRALRVSYKPTRQKRIAESAFMLKRGQGMEPDAIPEAEQWELVNLVWDASESEVLAIGEVFQLERNGSPKSWASSLAPAAAS
ncbi:MAG: formylmethanofuran dehydrogenase subunit E family protein [Gammaproteobacteria bacterium]